MLEKECVAALAIVRPHLSVRASALLEQTGAKVGNAVSQINLFSTWKRVLKNSLTVSFNPYILIQLVEFLIFKKFKAFKKKMKHVFLPLPLIAALYINRGIAV